jgi:hypothetical protein
MTDSYVELDRNPKIATSVDVNGVHTLKTTDTVPDSGSVANFTLTGTTTFTGPIIGDQKTVTADADGRVIAVSESGSVFTNEGAAGLDTFTLPAAAAGLYFTFVVQDADGIKIQAVGNDTIRLGDPVEVSGAAGFAQSTAIGSTLTLVAINAVEWVAVALNGSWSAV